MSDDTYGRERPARPLIAAVMVPDTTTASVPCKPRSAKSAQCSTRPTPYIETPITIEPGSATYCTSREAFLKNRFACAEESCSRRAVARSTGNITIVVPANAAASTPSRHVNSVFARRMNAISADRFLPRTIDDMLVSATTSAPMSATQCVITRGPLFAAILCESFEEKEHMARNDLNGKRVAILATDGVEQVELTEPRKALDDAGATTIVVSPKEGKIKAWQHDHWGDEIPVDRALERSATRRLRRAHAARRRDESRHLRMDKQAVQFVKAFFQAGKPVAAICHGPWLLVEADVVRNRNSHVVAVAADGHSKRRRRLGRTARSSPTWDWSRAGSPMTFRRSIERWSKSSPKESTRRAGSKSLARQRLTSTKEMIKGYGGRLTATKL